MGFLKFTQNVLVRKIGRWIWYFYLTNFLRAFYVKMARKPRIDKLRQEKCRVAVVFLAPGFDVVGGGVMSIVDLARATRRCLVNADAFVCVCTAPWHPPLARYSRFANDEILLDADAVFYALGDEAFILFQVPEIYIAEFRGWLENKVKKNSTGRIHVNMLLQNIDMIPEREDVENIKKIASVSCTTAHKAYANKATAQRVGCEVSHLSVWVSPEKYRGRKTTKKERLIIYSPDECPEKDFVLDAMRRNLSDFRFVEIRNLDYEQYLDLASRAFVSITFGEGLDGYFVEPVFMGGIGCAVYNDRFFTKQYEGLPFIYQSWDEMVRKVAGDIRDVEDPRRYLKVHGLQFDQASSDYSSAEYDVLVGSFYERNVPAALLDN